MFSDRLQILKTAVVIQDLKKERKGTLFKGPGKQLQHLLIHYNTYLIDRSP